MEHQSVRYKTVTIRLYPWRERWRFIWHDENDVRRYTTKKNLADAKSAALARAKIIHSQSRNLESLDPNQIRAINRMLDADPTMSLVDDFLRFHFERNPTTETGKAKADFLAIKEGNRGASSQNVKTLTSHLKYLDQFASIPLSQLSVSDIAPILSQPSHVPRTRLNIHRSFSTFFKWARKVGHVPDRPTVIDQIEKPIVPAATPATYTPNQLNTIIEHVPKSYLPWVALSAWAGIRTDEMYPLSTGEKPALDWSDIDWERKIIIVPAAVAKTKRRRVIPLLPCVQDVLYPIARPSGRIGTKLDPSSGKSKTEMLGNLIGGWKRNALRHSFISYRAALVGIAQAAMEAGNSESESRRSYNDSKSQDEARAWFRMSSANVPQKT